MAKHTFGFTYIDGACQAIVYWTFHRQTFYSVSGRIPGLIQSFLANRVMKVLINAP